MGQQNKGKGKAAAARAVPPPGMQNHTSKSTNQVAPTKQDLRLQRLHSSVHMSKNQPNNLMVSQRVASADTHTNDKELVYQYTDFFDYNVPTPTEGSIAASVTVVGVAPTQSFFGGIGLSDAGSTLARIAHVEAWVLPRASNNNVASASFVAATGVLVKPGVDDSQEVLACVQNTIVNPTFNTGWKRIVNYSTADVFGDNLAFPNSATGIIEAFRVAMVNPDNGAVIFDQAFQVMYRITLKISLPVTSSLTVQVDPVNTWLSKPSGTAESFVMAQVIGITNSS